MSDSHANPSETVKNLRKAREAYIDHFRVTGEQQLARTREIESALQRIIDQSDANIRAEALFELATLQRLTNRFDAAIATFQEAVTLARQTQNKAVEFNACIGIARAHAYGTRNHGAAAAAFDQAVHAAGEHPTEKQQYDLADYNAQLNAGRGELGAALLSGLEAIQFAQSQSDLYYAHLDTGDVLQKMAESCDYRKLIDAKSFDEQDQDPYGACRRAVAAAGKHYSEAEKIAQSLGWHFLQNQTAGFNKRLDMRLMLIGQKASFEKISQTGVFQAQRPEDVLVNDQFEAGASTLSGNAMLQALIGMVVPDAESDDPRSLYLLGLKADLAGDAETALKFFQQASQLLRQERSSLFDIRQRGTVLENRVEIIRDLAIRLLSFNQYNDAFVAFESMRSYGLGVLSTAIEQARLTPAERRGLAALVGLSSQLSAKENLLVEATIAGMDSDRTAERLNAISAFRGQQADLLRQPETTRIIEKLADPKLVMADLKTFRDAVKKAGIPVLLYWVTHTNVIVWLVTPDHDDVKAVFLPEVALTDKIQKLGQSIGDAGHSAFDTRSARELHTYLIKPFMPHLKQKQILIIPQGVLVGLPFEALMDAQTGRFLVEDVAVSYAPSATFALNTLKKKALPVKAISALYDPMIENETKEISKMGALSDLDVNAVASAALSKDDIFNLIERNANVHILLHGQYSPEDPLQSTIEITAMPMRRSITAAELLSADWRKTTLAVFSSCEGARVQTRISNEFSGISWAVLAGGADNLVLSRWRVRAESHADWMETFYRSLASNAQSPALAAADAMRMMIQKGQSNPFFWAGPQVFGK